MIHSEILWLTKETLNSQKYNRCRVCQMSENTNSIILSGLARQWVLNKDPTVWLDGAGSPPKRTGNFLKVKS